ncbi:DUF354 domain-containing protein [Methanosarcina mazei]|nr:DUF354 domain-containing protein [Methanosarcina mazei]
MIDMGHPAHVHLFKNAIWELQKKGHKVLVTARDKEVTIDLLKLYNIEHIVVGKIGSSKLDLIREWIIRDYEILKIAKKFDPDILIGMSNPCAAHISRILGKKSILMDETEHASFLHKVTYPFADVICTPSYYRKDLGNKQVKYNGSHGLAHLHPKYYTPNPDVLNEIGLKIDDTLIVLRFVLWGASHDTGQSGISDKVKFVHELEKYGKVLITSEIKLSSDLEKYRIKVSPEKLHDLLYYSSLYIGEGGTTASESATLGTHAIHISTTAKYCGVFDELHNYGLMWTFDDENGSIELAKELLSKPDLWELGKEKRKLFVRDHINVTDFMIWLFENYPESLSVVKQTPNFQDKFAAGEFL